MKIYKQPEAPYIIRVNIKCQGQTPRHITLFEATIDEVIQHCKRLIEGKKLSVFAKGNVTSIEAREAKSESGRDNGKMKSISFRGMTVIEVHKLIMNSLN